MANETALLARIAVDTGALQAELNSAANSISRFGSNVKSALGALAGAFSIGALTSFVRSTLDAADQLDEMSQSVGVSVENLTALRYAFSFSGISAGEMDKALVKLNGKIADAAAGGKESSAVFQALGVSVKNASGQLINTDEALGQIADAFANARDDAAKTSIAVELFGKQGAALIPTLNLGSEGLQRLKEEAQALGIVIGGDTASAAAKFNDELDKLSAGAEAAKIAIVGQFLPFLQQTVEEFNAARRASGGLVEAFGLLAKQSQQTLDAPAEKIRALRIELTKLEVEQQAVLDENAEFSKQYAAQYNERIGLLKNEIGFLKELERNRALANKASYSNEGRQALQSLSTALEDAKKKQEAETEAKKKAAEATRKWASDYEAAQKTVNELLSKGSGLSNDYTEKLKQLELWYSKNTTKTDEYRRAVEQLIFQQPFYKEGVEEITKAEEKRLKVMEDERNAWTKSMTSAGEMLESLNNETQALKMTNVEREVAIKLRELERLGIQKGTATYEEFAAAIRQAVIDKATVQQSVDAADKIKDEWKRATEQIEQSLTDALVQGFNGGKNILKSVGEYIVTFFRTTVARGIAQALTGAIMGGFSGLANAGGLNLGSLFGGGGGTSAAGSAGSLFNLGSLFGGMGSFGTGAMSTINAWLGGSAFEVAGGNLAAMFGAGDILGAAGVAAPYLLPVAAAVFGLSKLFGNKRSPAQQNYSLVQSGGLSESDYFAQWAPNLQSATAYDDLLGSVVSSVDQIVGKLGGTAAQLNYGLFTSASPDNIGAAYRFDIRNALGEGVFNRTLNDANEKLAENIASVLPAVLLTGLQQANLPEEFAAIFRGLNADTVTEQQIADAVAQAIELQDAKDAEAQAAQDATIDTAEYTSQTVGILRDQLGVLESIRAGIEALAGRPISVTVSLPEVNGGVA